jgi:Protein of unknown function (DUF1059)
VTVKQIDCVCGVVVKGEDDDELWERAQAHLRSDHPDRGEQRSSRWLRRALVFVRQRQRGSPRDGGGTNSGER